jgi:hypothetical protein
LIHNNYAVHNIENITSEQKKKIMFFVQLFGLSSIIPYNNVENKAKSATYIIV